MFPPLQILGPGPSSPGAQRVPPDSPGHNPVIQPISSSSTPPPGLSSGAPGRLPIRLPMQQLQLTAEPQTAELLWIGVLRKIPEFSKDGYDSKDLTNDLSDLGSAEGKPPLSLKQTEFTLNQFSKMIGQANYSVFNQQKIVWVAEFLETQSHGRIQGQNCLEQLLDGLMRWEQAVDEFW